MAIGLLLHATLGRNHHYRCPRSISRISLRIHPQGWRLCRRFCYAGSAKPSNNRQSSRCRSFPAVRKRQHAHSVHVAAQNLVSQGPCITVLPFVFGMLSPANRGGGGEWVFHAAALAVTCAKTWAASASFAPSRVRYVSTNRPNFFTSDSR